MSEPKACPCGGQVYVGELKFTGETQWCVGCLHCNRGSGKHVEKAAAIAAWNAYVFSVVGKAQRPEESAEREAWSEPIPTPEGQGGELLKRLKHFQRRMVAKTEEPELHELLGLAIEALSSPRVEEVRREALEEAAKVADGMAINRARVSQAAAYACQSIADRIRALSLQVG